MALVRTATIVDARVVVVVVVVVGGGTRYLVFRLFDVQ